jgi:hypothetical protein
MGHALDEPKEPTTMTRWMSEIFEASDYPQGPGFKEPTTSKDAAIAVLPRVRALHGRILATLRYLNCTPDEVAIVLGTSLLAIRPRFSELHKLGLIEKTGERRTNASGLSANVWRKSL